MREALKAAPSVYVVVGSAFAACSPRNPWTYEERAAIPGKGLRALPGGFLDQGETLLQAALR